MSTLIRIDGLLDIHTHLRDMDWAHKATVLSETRAAVAGGYTAVFDMPNTPPETISDKALRRKLHVFETTAVCDWGVYAGASQADNTAEYPAMAQYCCGLKLFCNSTTGSLLIESPAERDRHFAAWTFGTPVAVHAEEETVCDILELVRKYRRKTHFLHISSAFEVKTLIRAKQEGLPVTFGICPHHLYLTEDDVRTLKGYGMMKPPLKRKSDTEALWQSIANGAADVIESDHAPHTKADKEAAKPAYGVPGLETNLPLMLTAVRERGIPLERITAMMSDNPRRIWNLPARADTYTIVDLDTEYVLDGSRMFSVCGRTPFDGMPVRGKVRETVIRGVQVFDGERVLAPPGFGKNLFPDTKNNTDQ